MKKSILALCSFVPLFSWGLSIDTPRCEFALNPVGLANSAPRFSWALKDADPQMKTPTGVELRVARSLTDLQAGKNLQWSYCMPRQADLFALCYQGKPLVSGSPYFWQVRLLHSDESPATAWSVPARFSIALQNKEEWGNAQWIGEVPATLAAWGDQDINIRLTLKKAAVGILFHVVDSYNTYMWQLNTTSGKLLLRPHVMKNGKWTILQSQSIQEKFLPNLDLTQPMQVKISTRGNLIKTAINGKWVSEIRNDVHPAGLIGFRTCAGEEADIDEITVSSPDGKLLFKNTFDTPAQNSFPKGKIANGSLRLKASTLFYAPEFPKNCPRFRRGFTLPQKQIRHAFASVCGLGFYELYLNGKKTNAALLAPANTSYQKRLLFDTIDVKEFLQAGQNKIGIWLAPGYSDDYSQWGWKWECAKRAILHLAITFEDGTRQTIVTDPEWEYTDKSPLTYASLYHGEIYDASLRNPQWVSPSAPSTGWRPVAILPSQGIPLQPNDMPPVLASDPRKPIQIAEPEPGVYVADFGQNRAGWTQIRAKGPKGTKITLQHSELIGKDGLIDPWTNRKAKATDTFILAGTGDWETYTPRFTYHGFRYVQITGYPGEPTADDITGFAVHADLEPAGSFRCSEETLNRLYNAAKWSMLSNLQTIPTDCPMRDERTPCQMDSQTYEDGAIQYFNMARYYTKWLGDIRGSRGEPDWSGDSSTLLWRLYKFYGDRRFLEKGYEQIKLFAEKTHDPSYPAHRFKDAFGDWCRPNDGTWKGYHGDPELVNAVIYSHTLDIAANTAGILGRLDDQRKYRNWFYEMLDILNTEMLNSKTGAYMGGSQTTSILPLAFGYVPAKAFPSVKDHLLQTIHGKDKCKLDTGIFGTRYIGDVLCDMGEADLAVTLFTQPEYPGFGYFFAHDATTLWEQWTIKCGMNSHNHAMFSGAAYMLFTRLGGIRTTAPGYAGIEIAPSFPQQLQFAKAARITPRGLCACSWKREGEQIKLEITIPPFTPATLRLPGKKDRMLKSGKNEIVYQLKK